jgi:hypothetical protein
MKMFSIYLGMPIGFNRYENSKHGQEVFPCRLGSMLDDARQIGRSKLRITQKIHTLKMFVFPRIDYRMMCSDLSRTHLDRLDAQFVEWFGNGLVFVGSQLSYSSCHGEMVVFSFLCLRDRQNTLVIRTLLLILALPDDGTRKFIKQF